MKRPEFLHRLRSRRYTNCGIGDIEPSRLSARDLGLEAVAGILQRPARSALTALGTVLGVGTFVAVLGLTTTTSSQIDTRFNSLTATEVTIEDTGGPRAEFVPLSFPSGADTLVGRLNGVEAAGVYWPVNLDGGLAVRAAPLKSVSAVQSQVFASSPGVLAAARPRFATGRSYDAWHERTSQRVAVLGASTAEALGITTLETAPAVFIGEHPFLVIGIVGEVERKAELLASVLVPRSTALQLWGNPSGERAKMLISTRPGAAVQIASEAPLALDPAHPERFTAIPPPDPKSLRTSVSSDLNQLFLLLATLCLVIGAVGIANTTLVAVLERRSEIGLRRALGARGRHVTAQFLSESGALGALGGVVGTSLGVLSVLAVSIAREWTPVIHPMVVVGAPIIGLATGLLAGLYPAWRAARVQPAETLRH
ncbi:ABC transporter permease [Streptomyces sp. NPDC051561]|uniref:ABC transporter permease n=1 Tax=Streptomyces sp. NPDC051561 TaxID=3365658 RepID=UPI0037AA0E47